MFQDFTNSSTPELGAGRLADLRSELRAENLAGFLVPRTDQYQGENVAPRDERLSWLTGFTGSAGFCIALADCAGVFIDGRYRIQVKSQIDPNVFIPVNWPETQPGKWLIDALPEGGEIGFDPWLHSWNEIDKISKSLEGSLVHLRPTGNLIDRIWASQPAPPCAPAFVYPDKFAGTTHPEKRARIAKHLRNAGHSATILTLPESIAWLLNIRGGDIANTPVAHCLAILHDDARLDLFIDPLKIDQSVGDHLAADVTLHSPEQLSDAIRALSGQVLIDKLTVPVAIVSMLDEGGSEPVLKSDPCLLPKSRKSGAEIKAARTAHQRDGAAMVEFLCWLDATAPAGGLSEIDAAQKLEGFRRATNALRNISFDTISATGAHGALPHYRVTQDSNLLIEPGHLYLVDSGGQYLDGTTDITRTVAIGSVGGEEKTCFTRVLQGMIAMSRARWPKGLTGRDLDPLARYPLWLAGQDYDHGTGHGVGAFLGVHEGPARLSRATDVALESGMILSNEPGYYREGAFGIRIENLLVVTPAPVLSGGDDREMLAFETLAFVPIDVRLIVKKMLSDQERDWINAYHAQTYDRLASAVSPDAKAWLKTATQPV